MSVMQSPPGPETTIDGRRYLYFAGTGYLGLQGHPDVTQAACEAMRRYGIGSATSRSGLGDSPPVVEVERLVAELFGTETAFYFPSGYVGNHILVEALGDRVDAVFLDEYAHYSVAEAARLPGRPVHRFAHADPQDLRRQFATHLPAGARPLVLSDGVFSARGTVAPLADYRALLADYPGSILAIDDAHGFGVLGDRGRGTLEHAGLFEEGVNRESVFTNTASSPPALLCCGTLSKALGGYGGIIPGSRAFITHLKTAAPHYAGMSPPPVPVAAASARALRCALDTPAVRDRLRRNALRLKSGLRGRGFPADDTPVPIVALELGDAQNMERIHRELMGRGIVVAYFRNYAGLGAQGALRIAVFATHTAAMIERLLDELASATQGETRPVAAPGRSR